MSARTTWYAQVSVVKYEWVRVSAVTREEALDEVRKDRSVLAVHGEILHFSEFPLENEIETCRTIE